MSIMLHCARGGEFFVDGCSCIDESFDEPKPSGRIDAWMLKSANDHKDVKV